MCATVALEWNIEDPFRGKRDTSSQTIAATTMVHSHESDNCAYLDGLLLVLVLEEKWEYRNMEMFGKLCQRRLCVVV